MRDNAIVVGALSAALLATVARADPIDDAFAPWSGPDQPGCAVGLRHADQPADLRAYGVADLEHGVPITIDTVFESGSVAKQFTAAAVLLLVQDGRLALDQDIRTWLPELSQYGRPITIDHLLTHTSGLRDWSDLADFTGWPRYSRVYSNMDALRITARQKALNHPPGERYAYTNTGYNLLAVIVERATGQSLAEFTQARIFTPLGMTHTGWRDDFRRIVPGRAVGYVREGDRLVLGAPMENAYGSGGMLTTVKDLLAWEDALDHATLGGFVTGKLQEPAVLRNGTRTAYGRGLQLSSYRGQTEIFHNGGTNGYQAWAGRYPDQRLTIVMLCNGRTVGPDTQVRKIASLFLPPEPASPPPQSPSPEELALRSGLYVGQGPFEVLDLVAKGGELRLAGGVVLPMIAPGVYRLGTSELRFASGGVERRMRDGEVRRFVRETRTSPGDAELTPLVGRYVSDEVSGAYDLTIDGRGLLLTHVGRPDRTEPLTPLFRDGFLGPGYLMRVVRDARGRAVGLRFQTPRVYALDFARATTDALPTGDRRSPPSP